jgi:hypothetical protein
MLLTVTEGWVTLRKEMMIQCPYDQSTVIQVTVGINITHKMPSERWKCAHGTQATFLKCVLCDFIHRLVSIFIHCCKGKERYSCPRLLRYLKLSHTQAYMARGAGVHSAFILIHG